MSAIRMSTNKLKILHQVHLGLFIIYLSLNWNLVVGEEDFAATAPPDVPPAPAAQDVPREVRKQHLIDRIEKAKHKIKERVIEGTLDAQDQLKKLKALKDSYKPYMNCMGNDFLNKCKFILLRCAVIPNPLSCLHTMRCGAFNNKKCKGLLPNAKGNNTQSSIGGVTPIPVPTTPPQVVDMTTLPPITSPVATAAPGDSGISTTESGGYVLDAVLKAGNPMQDLDGQSPEDREKERAIRKQQLIEKIDKAKARIRDKVLDKTLDAADNYVKVKARVKATVNNLNLEAQDQMKKLKVLKDKYQSYANCMGKDFWEKCKNFLLTCAVMPNAGSCITSMTCGANSVNNKKCKKLLPGGDSTQPPTDDLIPITTIPTIDVVETTQPPTTASNPDTTTIDTGYVLDAVLKESHPAMQDGQTAPPPEAQTVKASNELEDKEKESAISKQGKDENPDTTEAQTEKSPGAEPEAQ